MLSVLRLSPMGAAIGGIYGVVGTLAHVNSFFNEHIERLKASDNKIIASTGRVLEGAKFGFGLGYAGSIAILAAGQLLLGNTLAAVAVVGSGMVVANPIAMTCAAIGAVYYGWAALTEEERSAIVDRLAEGLEMGTELIRSLISFAIRTTSDLLSSKQLQEFKTFIANQAAQFGKSLYDVTHQMADFVKGTAIKAGDLTGQALTSASTAVKDAARFAGQAAGDTATKVGQLTGKAVESTSSAVKTAASSVSHAAEKTASTAKAVGRAATLVAKRPGPLVAGVPVVSTVEEFKELGYGPEKNS
jgi:hypothetical protein